MHARMQALRVNAGTHKYTHYPTARKLNNEIALYTWTRTQVHSNDFFLLNPFPPLFNKFPSIVLIFTIYRPSVENKGAVKKL